MKIEQIREMNADDLRKEINDQQVELMKLRLGVTIGIVDNPNELREKRKVIARMKTVLTEKEKLQVAS